MVGSYEIYAAFKEYDPHFKDLFRVCVDFQESIDNTPQNIFEFGQYIRGMCQKENIQPIDDSAFIEIIQYSNRLAEHQKKLSSNMTPILLLLREANEIAIGTITKDEIGRAHV